MKPSDTSSLRHAREQGMTEYIIIVALIAVASIGVYSYFGKPVRNQSAAMAAPVGGAGMEAHVTDKAGTEAGKEATSISNQPAGPDSFTNAPTKQ
jgi:Flp pilus assembly pilin Flp